MEVAIAVLLALLPFVWQVAALWVRRWRFQKLMYRELEELGPARSEAIASSAIEPDEASWKKHLPARRFLHREILGNPSANRDFILSLSPNETYSVTQFWSAYEAGDANQFVYFLSRIARCTPFRFIAARRKLAEISERWSGVVKTCESLNQEKLRHLSGPTPGDARLARADKG